MRNQPSISAIVHRTARLRHLVVGLLFVALCLGSGFAGRFHLEADHTDTGHCDPLAVAACTSGDDHAGFAKYRHHHDSNHDHRGHQDKDDGSTQHDPSTCNTCLQLLLAQAAAATTADAPAFLEFIEVPDGRIIAVVKPAKTGTLTDAAPRGPPRT